MANNAAREQAFSLIAAAKNHANLAVKLSSLKQAKDILLTLEPPQAAEFFPYLVELHHSPEFLVKQSLIGLIEEIGLKALTHASSLVPVLLAFLRDDNPKVASQSIATGTNYFSSVLEEMALQFYQHGKVERWLEELWIWMIRFKDAVFAVALEPGYVGTKLLALKFLETLVILFTPSDSENRSTEGSKRAFNISWLDGSHPVLNPVVLNSEANRIVGILLDLLQSANNLSGSITISVVNCLTSIARKRPVHYGSILSALLGVELNLEMVKDRHTASVQYSLRTAFLGFLRCTDSVILESRDRLLQALRAMNAGDAADQVLRQVDKMIRNAERASRDARHGKDEQTSTQILLADDLSKKRYMPPDNDGLTNGHEVSFKRVRHDREVQSTSLVNENDFGQDSVSANGVSPHAPLLDNDLTPAEQMISMIGALLAEGERGIESLELLISQFPPDLLADIVITNMKHLPKEPPLVTRTENLSESQHKTTLSSAAEVPASSNPMNSPFASQASVPSVTAPGTSIPDQLASSNFPGDPKRDPRRDPRRLDPRRVAVSVGVTNMSAAETGSIQSEDNALRSTKLLPSSLGSDEIPSPPLLSNIKYDNKALESPRVSLAESVILKEDVMDGGDVSVPDSENEEISDHPPISAWTVNEEPIAVELSENNMTHIDVSDSHDSDEHSPATSDVASEEITGPELPLVPLFVELTEDHQRNVRVSAFERIVESYRHLSRTNCNEMRMAVLARLVSQTDTDDSFLAVLQKYLAVDYQKQKGHELVLHVLFHLYALWTSDMAKDTMFALVTYEKFLLAVAKSLLDSFPASDKSFSRLLGEVPFLPDSTLKLLDDLCSADVIDESGRAVRDVERVTQGLGAVWSLILGRPNSREACLNIALKCAIHPQDDIRAKAIRLVANKLYLLNFTSEHVKEFATSKLMSAVDQRVTEDSSHCVSVEQRSEGEVERLETSISGSQFLEQGISGSDSREAQPNHQSVASISVAEAQQLISLFFALCTKKPNLIQLVFNIYSKAQKTVKQAIHRHIPVVVRAIGSSCAEFLSIVSDLPEGSENLLMLVLQILTEDGKASPELIATVKHLYETKLKDATILIPMLSSLSKTEVLPIFPRLVDLPPEKFQRALANILQGSAHTGPALTPAEVLVAIHSISPEKDGLPLKKITNVCSACFEQRTVFTQQVLAKALSQMIDQTPLPLLFMRTVIQAIDAFPTLVDFVMEILSKLVSKQVWRMPKLWVGFLKCAVQTQPHSFPVLLQLPAPQLESTLSKNANLRGPLAAYADQPTIRTSLPRQTLSILGLANEYPVLQPHIGSTLHHLDTGSVNRASPT